jgi:hypothetical protein
MLVLAKTPAKVREINNVQFWSAVTPIMVGPLTLLALMASNILKDPQSKMPKEKFWANFIEFLGKSYQPLFQALTLNNLIISLLQASPARALTYISLAVANFFSMQNEWSLIEISKKLCKLDAEISKLETQLAHLNSNDEKTRQLKKEIQNYLEELYNEEDYLYKQGSKLHAQIGFFGRVIYNSLMMFSFLFFLPQTSRTCRYETEKDPLKQGQFVGQLPQGFKWDNILNGNPGPEGHIATTPPYFELLMKRAKLEFWDCPKEVIKEFFSNLGDLGRAQGTLWGRNNAAEKLVREANEKGGNPLLNRYRIRLASGLGPSLLTLFNVFARFGIIGTSLVAASQLGMAVFNRGSPFDEKSHLENVIQDEKNPTGKMFLDMSNSLIWNARMLSGISGLLTSFNPSFLAMSGYPSMIVNAIGSGLTSLSALAGSNPQLASVDLFLQFAGSIFLFLTGGLSNLYWRTQKGTAAYEIINKSYNHGLTAKK